MFMQTVFITGADRGVGLALCQCFLQGGWKVYAGQFMTRWKELEKLKKEYPDRLSLIPLDVSKEESVKEAAKLVQQDTSCLDMLINCAGIAIGNEPDSIKSMYRVNVLGPMCMVENFLPLMQDGLRRLCFVSSEAGSVSLAHRDSISAYGMSKTSLNMAVRLMFNQLREEGYTFRLYHPGWVRSYMQGDEKSTMGKFEPEETAQVAYQSFVEDRDWEDVLMMTDVLNEMWAF